MKHLVQEALGVKTWTQEELGSEILASSMIVTVALCVAPGGIYSSGVEKEKIPAPGCLNTTSYLAGILSLLLSNFVFPTPRPKITLFSVDPQALSLCSIPYEIQVLLPLHRS